MKKVALNKVAKIDRTVATDDDCLTLPYVGLEHVEKESGRFAEGFAPTPLNMLATNFRFTPKHVLYGKLRPYLNKVVLPNFDGVCTTEILPILPNEEKLDRTFLWAILLSPTFVNWATSQISGANLPRLDPKLLAEYEIPLPPLTEQKRIASLLTRADRLRQLRRTAHDLGDALLQSVFLEMFGDLAVNQKHWDLLFLEDIADVHGGIQVTSTRNSMKLQKSYLRVANVYRNQLDLSEIKVIGLTPSEFERTKLKKDDLLFVEGHGNINEIGRAAVWDGSIEDCVHQNHLICARLDLKLANPIFVSTYVNSPAGKSYFTNISNTTSGLNTISTNTVKSCPIPLPPLSLQEEFAGAVARGRMGESTRQVEGLFESLLSEAFQK